MVVKSYNYRCFLSVEYLAEYLLTGVDKLERSFFLLDNLAHLVRRVAGEGRVKSNIPLGTLCRHFLCGV